MKLRNLNIVILGAIGLLISACDSSGGDSINDNNGEIIVNGDGNSVMVEIVDGSDTNENTPDEDESNDSQNDCRRPDVLRIGFQIPGADLVLFPNSVLLPTQNGSGIRRMIQIPDGNPVFFDSLVISEIGTVSVTHVSEGPEDTVMELFDLDLENEIRTIAVSGQVNEFNGRARVDIALLPGVYCIYLADAATEAFPNSTSLTVDYIFTP